MLNQEPHLCARQGRDQAAVQARLEDVRVAARGTGNLLLPMRAALLANAPLGEISDALRDVFGTYEEPAVF